MRRKRHQNFIWMIGFDRCNLNFRANLSPIHHHHCEPNSTTLLSPSPVRNGHTSVSTKLGILRIFFCEISKINISFNFFPVVSPQCGLKLNKWFQEFNWDKENLLFNFGEMKNYIFSFLFSEPLNTSQDIYIVSHSAEMIPGWPPRTLPSSGHPTS